MYQPQCNIKQHYNNNILLMPYNMPYNMNYDNKPNNICI